MFGFFGKPSRSKFAKLVMAAAKNAGFEHPRVYQDDFTLYARDGIVDLRESFDRYCRGARRDRTAIIAGAVQLLASSAANELARRSSDTKKAQEATARYGRPLAHFDPRVYWEWINPASLDFAQTTEKMRLAHGPGSFSLTLEAIRGADDPMWIAWNAFARRAQKGDTLHAYRCGVLEQGTSGYVIMRGESLVAVLVQVLLNCAGY